MPVPFHEVQFPVNIAQGTVGGPRYSTRVITMSSGSEVRIQNWNDGKLEYQVGYTANPADMAAIISFFRNRKGKTFGWRLKDWSDYQCLLEALDNSGGGSTLKLTKTYSSGAFNEIRRINKPCDNGTFKLYHNSVLQSSGYSVDFTTGIVTVSGGVSGGTWAWSGDFDVPMRFNQDNLEFTQDTVGKRTLSAIPTIELFIEDV